MSSKPNQPSSTKPIVIRQVWSDNLDLEFAYIRSIFRKFRYISMFTKFPGVIHAPKVDVTIPYHLRHMDSYEQYSYLKANVDDLKLIQVGLTLTDDKGNLPDFGTDNSYIWEFNFNDFDVEHDHQNPDSVNLLCHKGIDFERNRLCGVSSSQFAELMFSSGILFNDQVVWVTFHSSYDFGYLVKAFTGRKLPSRLEEFLRLLTQLFGKNVYDIKYMIKHCNELYDSLERVAKSLQVSRAVGNSHQAGSDSLLTWLAFDKMVDTHFINNKININKYAGVLFGLELTAA